MPPPRSKYLQYSDVPVAWLNFKDQTVTSVCRTFTRRVSLGTIWSILALQVIQIRGPTTPVFPCNATPPGARVMANGPGLRHLSAFCLYHHIDPHVKCRSRDDGTGDNHAPKQPAQLGRQSYRNWAGFWMAKMNIPRNLSCGQFIAEARHCNFALQLTSASQSEEAPESPLDRRFDDITVAQCIQLLSQDIGFDDLTPPGEENYAKMVLKRKPFTSTENEAAKMIKMFEIPLFGFNSSWENRAQLRTSPPPLPATSSSGRKTRSQRLAALATPPVEVTALPTMPTLPPMTASPATDTFYPQMTAENQNVIEFSSDSVLSDLSDECV